jgi:hypothetical protein
MTVVGPGPIWTPLLPSTTSPEKAADLGTNAPLGTPLQPADSSGTSVSPPTRDSELTNPGSGMSDTR